MCVFVDLYQHAYLASLRLPPPRKPFPLRALLTDIMKPGGLMTEYLLSAKIAIIIGDVLIIHGALHTYNMG